MKHNPSQFDFYLFRQRFHSPVEPPTWYEKKLGEKKTTFVCWKRTENDFFFFFVNLNCRNALTETFSQTLELKKTS